jgi:hypothetical protein
MAISIYTMAEFAEASYILNDKKLNKQQRKDKVNNKLSDKGYKLHDASNKDVQLFVNDKTNHAVISHRGTDFGGRKIAKDVKADLAYMAGKEGEYTKQFKQRASKTKKLLKEIDPSTKLTMVGHSYGGASVNNTLLKEPAVRDRVDNVHLYNPLTHHVGDSKVHTKRGEKKDDADDQLNDLITIHRTKNDVASLSKSQHGTVKNYNQKVHSTKKSNPFRDVFDKVEQLSAHSLKNFI